MLAAGTRLGPFAITSLLGVGGMGEVYRARDERLGRDVAIKVLPTVVALDPERRARFQREARVLANLNHPNIGAIHGLEEHDGFFALVLEFVDGDTLADVVARGPMAPAVVAQIAHQLVDALDAAHERGIVHRDLKPANVKLTLDNTIKVLDFGLAKAAEAPGQSTDPMLSPTVTSGGTRDGVIMGTAAYMSPEQARGRPVDKRADIWAFGCVLYELLTGERPFPGDSVSDVIVSVLQREPRWEALPTTTPRGLVRLLRRCLEKDARARLRDIGDAREYLHAEGTSTAAPLAAPPRRNWQLVAAGGMAGAALALTLAWLWTTRAAVEAPSFDKIVRIVATSAHEFGPAISPDGKWIAYVSDARGPTDVWVKFISGGETVNLTEKLDVVVQTQDYISGLQISPDGASLAFSGTALAAAGTNQQQSWIIPAPLGGPARPAIDAMNQGLTGSPDGTRIAYMRAGGSAGDAVWVADADGGNAKQILAPVGGLHAHWLRWSADGHYIYFNRGWQNFNTGPTEVYRVPVAGGTAEPAVRSFRRAVYPFPDAQGRGFFYGANRDSPDLSLWWRDLRSGRDVRVTTGVGEYGAPSVSADGTRLVATLTTIRQQVVRLDLSHLPVVAPQPLSDPFSGDMDPAWSADGSRIAFSSLRGGARNIWTARADLTGVTQLTTGDSIDERPTFSPDGREIAFVSDRGGRRAIWLINAAGGTPRLLTETPIISNASWSRDGRRLVFSLPAVTGPTLAIVSRDDGKVTPLPVSGAASFPVWSPRADVIAYLETRTDGGGVFCRTVDPDGRPVALGFPDRPIQAANGFIAWSPDAERIASVSMPGARTGSIWILDKTAADPLHKVIDLPAATHVRGIAWTPDGQSLIAGFDARSGDIVLAQKASAGK
jgi:Tol biopolymer transport system component